MEWDVVRDQLRDVRSGLSDQHTRWKEPPMYPDPFRDLEVAYRQLTRRPPCWVSEPALVRCGDLDGIVAAIRNDRPDPSDSDTVLRALAAIARHDHDAATVGLYSLSAELRKRLSRAVTGEYRADALGDLAAVILEGNSAGVGLGHRFVNRAHNRTNKHHRGVRHHGRTVPSTVDPLPTDRVVEHQDRQVAPADIGDVVAARLDLERFRMAIAAAITAGELTEEAWQTYADHRLRVVYLPDRSPVPTRQRVAAYRAAKRLQPIVDFHLQGHAA